MNNVNLFVTASRRHDFRRSASHRSSPPFSVHSGEFHRELCRQYGNCSITASPLPLPRCVTYGRLTATFTNTLSQLTSHLILSRRLSGNVNFAFFEIRREISTRYLLSNFANSAMSLMKITHIHARADQYVENTSTKFDKLKPFHFEDIINLIFKN